MNRITLLVLPLMLIELITAFMIVFTPIEGIPRLVSWVGLVLVLLIWGLTGLVNAPQHMELAQGFDTNAHQALMTTNWIRTVLWTVRGCIVIGIIWVLMHQ